MDDVPTPLNANRMDLLLAAADPLLLPGTIVASLALAPVAILLGNHGLALLLGVAAVYGTALHVVIKKLWR